MKNNQVLSYICLGLLVLTIVIGISVGYWKFQRWWNYKVGYESMVQAQIDRRIKPLEARIEQLEKNSTQKEGE